MSPNGSIAPAPGVHPDDVEAFLAEIDGSGQRCSKQEGIRRLVEVDREACHVEVGIVIEDVGREEVSGRVEDRRGRGGSADESGQDRQKDAWSGHGATSLEAGPLLIANDSRQWRRLTMGPGRKSLIHVQHAASCSMVAAAADASFGDALAIWVGSPVRRFVEQL
jgi:hypothetical protein